MGYQEIREENDLLRTKILQNWRSFPMCHCNSPKYPHNRTPAFCLECDGLIGHSGMCSCKHEELEGVKV